MTSPKEAGLTHVLATFSVTFTGEGEEPLLAVRVLADGKPVEVPFVLLLGQDSVPLTLSGGMGNPENRVLYAEALTALGMDLAKSVIAELKAASGPAAAVVTQPRTSSLREQPRTSPREPGATPPPTPPLD